MLFENTRGIFALFHSILKMRTVYSRVRGVNWTALGTYNLTVTCVSHEHEYECVPLHDQFHILKCDCGLTSGSQSIHVVDFSALGRYKPCMSCGILVDTGGGSGIIVPGMGITIVPPEDTTGCTNRDEED